MNPCFTVLKVRNPNQQSDLPVQGNDGVAKLSSKYFILYLKSYQYPYRIGRHDPYSNTLTDIDGNPGKEETSKREAIKRIV